MFSNILMTALTPLCNTDENSCWQNRPFTTIWPEDHKPSSTTRSLDQPKNLELKKTIKKKKRHRTAFSTEQIQVLENTFYKLKYINAEKRKQLAETLNIGERSIKVWFQNRRMKEKRESSESSDSSTEATGSEESTPRPLSLASSSQELIDCESPKVENLQYFNDTYSKVGNNQLCGNFDQFTGYSCQGWSNYDSNNQSYSQNPAQSMVPPTKPFVDDRSTYLTPAKPFVDDRSTYPTSYYPTLVDYYLGESYQYESNNVNNNEIQWSANNFDLHYF